MAKVVESIPAWSHVTVGVGMEPSSLSSLKEELIMVAGRRVAEVAVGAAAAGLVCLLLLWLWRVDDGRSPNDNCILARPETNYAGAITGA